jgi:hypothetical protein
MNRMEASKNAKTRAQFMAQLSAAVEPIGGKASTEMHDDKTFFVNFGPYTMSEDLEASYGYPEFVCSWHIRDDANATYPAEFGSEVADVNRHHRRKATETVCDLGDLICHLTIAARVLRSTGCIPALES